jgi:hypothetical protein
MGGVADDWVGAAQGLTAAVDEDVASFFQTGNST